MRTLTSLARKSVAETRAMAALALLSIIVGMAAGLIGAAFRYALERADAFRAMAVAETSAYPILGPLMMMTGAALAAGLAAWLVRRFAPDAAGSGIPHVEAVLEGSLTPAPARLIPVKFVGGVLAMGSGLALGREGPSVQMGVTAANVIGGLSRRNLEDRRALISGGAGAGLATAFNAPGAGAIFVLEELVGRFDPRIALVALGASVGAITVSRGLLGNAFDFNVAELASGGVAAMAFFLLLGLFSGLPSVGHNRGLLATLSLAERIGGPIELRAACIGAVAAQEPERPNILIIFPDDVGWQNVSAYGLGTMGYQTPNIDRIAREGAIFTDHYAQPSCTAGRAALITGQYPIRSGMTTVGRPGSPLGLQPESPTLAEVLKEQGYRTGQFGKNHLGDRNEHLPTMHGFDEFFGNLYHLNTSEEPEQVDYPDDPEFVAKYGVRGVVRSTATDTDDPTEDPRFGRVGTQIIEDTGPLTRERMETVDQEFQAAAIDFMRRSQEAGDPFFVWLNPSRMHLYTHLTDESRYLAAPFTTEHDLYGSGMIEHDRQVGDLLAAMADLGVLDDTIVVYSTDNGPEHSARLHGGMTPFRGEKMTTYEGGVRVPMLVRWPGHIPAGTIRNGIQAHMDIFTTLAAAGVPDVATQMLEEQDQVLDGVDNLAYWTGASDDSARDNFLYYYESDIKAIRIGPWKVHFATSENYYDVYTAQKFPVFFNVRMDPFESYDEVGDRSGIVQRKQWLNEPIQEILGAHIQSLVEHPPVQEATSFDFSELMRQMPAGAQ